MSHKEIQELIHPYVDGELDVVNAREVEQHLSACDECRTLQERVRALSNALTQSAPAYRAPARLRKDVRSALRREAKPAVTNFLMLLSTGTACALFVFAFVFLTARTPSKAHILSISHRQTSTR
jgi:anti-sigma factor RsiW